MQRKHTSVHRGFLSTLSLRRATLRHRRTKLEKCSFLSTLSLRRATTRAPPYLDTLVNFYPRSPCGERPAAPKTRRAAWPFLSTLSLRRATITECRCQQVDDISIHALLAESDRPCPPQSGYCSNFYPRSPCGERRAPWQS